MVFLKENDYNREEKNIRQSEQGGETIKNQSC